MCQQTGTERAFGKLFAAFEDRAQTGAACRMPPSVYSNVEHNEFNDTVMVCACVYINIHTFTVRRIYLYIYILVSYLVERYQTYL
jgi:formaldehyde-activating enzyme involved in methanogenesis